MTMSKVLRASALLAALAAVALPARAENLLPRDEGFMQEPKSVAFRRYALDGRHDIGLLGGFSIKNKLTEHYGAALTWAYQFNEYLASDLLLEGGYGGTTSLVDNIRETAKYSGTKDDLADAGALVGTAQIGARFTPFYGKLSLASELPVHFNLYFMGGVGAALVNYNGVLACANDLGTASRCTGDFRSETLPTVAFNVGGGLRFWAGDLMSLRVEVRDVIYPDRYWERVDLKKAASTGQVAGSAGVSQIPLILVGLGFLL
jgi:outer membrane beta-barrel protein